jgi:hypothetical protein
MPRTRVIIAGWRKAAKNLRERLELCAIRDRDLEFAVARDWLAVDQKAWKKVDEAELLRARVKGPPTPFE